MRELLRVAHGVRSRVIDSDRRLRLRDAYALCFYLTRRLRHRYPDVRLMVGDRVGEHGLMQHHWLEIPSLRLYLDPAFDALDPFQPVRVGKISDPEFVTTYRNGLDGNIDVSDPRNRPEILYKSRSAFDPESRD